jgi:hypothetical protein
MCKSPLNYTNNTCLDLENHKINVIMIIIKGACIRFLFKCLNLVAICYGHMRNCGRDAHLPLYHIEKSIFGHGRPPK